MKSAVTINLDYERHSVETCGRIWEEISANMEAAGFSRHFRLFVADLGRETACKKAKAVVAAAEDKLLAEGIVVFDVVREFYWFEYQQINDLLAPANELPEVSFLDTGTFTAFINPRAAS